MARIDGERTPGFKLLLAILIGLALSIPLFSVWLLVYDRQTQSEQAAASITEGWGGPQAVSGPLLVIPYRTTATETVVENGQSVTRSRDVVQELSLSPEAVDLTTAIKPERRKRSIYEAVVYDAQVSGKARFAFPPDLARLSVDARRHDARPRRAALWPERPARPRRQSAGRRRRQAVAAAARRRQQQQRPRLFRLDRRRRPARPPAERRFRL